MNKSTKLEISLFKTALAYVGVDVDDDEVECMLANMIYKVRNCPLWDLTNFYICLGDDTHLLFFFGTLGLDISSF